jgi:hypothetical protein
LDLLIIRCKIIAKGLTVISTKASLRDAKWRNLLKSGFLGSPTARSK